MQKQETQRPIMDEGDLVFHIVDSIDLRGATKMPDLTKVMQMMNIENPLIIQMAEHYLRVKKRRMDFEDAILHGVTELKREVARLQSESQEHAGANGK